MTDVSDAARRAPAIATRAWVGLAVSSMAYVLVLDGLAIAVSFSKIEAAFPTTARTTLAWITTGFTIAIASLMLVSGQIANRIGWRRAFVLGMWLFVLGGVVAAAAPGVEILIAARVFQGGAAALFTVTAFPLALPAFPTAKRGLAMGWIGVGGAGAALIGPLAGAALITAFNWRAAILLPIPLCIAAAVTAPHVLDERGGERHPIDLVGVLLGAVGVGLLALSILQREPLLAPLAALTLLGFGVHTKRHPHPLVRPQLFEDRRYLWATVSGLATQVAIFAWFFSMPLFLANVWGWSTVEAGVAMAIPMLVSFNSVPSGRYADRRGYRPVLALGGLIASAGLVWWVVLLDSTPAVVILGAGLLLFGWGSGMVGVTGMGAALNSVNDDLLAEANAALQTSRRLIQGLGAAVALAILGNRDTTSLTNYRAVWLVAATGYALSALVLWFYPRERRFAALR